MSFYRKLAKAHWCAGKHYKKESNRQFRRQTTRDILNELTNGQDHMEEYLWIREQIALEEHFREYLSDYLSEFPWTTIRSTKKAKRKKVLKPKDLQNKIEHLEKKLERVKGMAFRGGALREYLREYLRKEITRLRALKEDLVAARDSRE